MKRYIIGVDIGGTHTKVALLGSGGRILYKTDFPTQDYKRAALIKALSEAVRIILEKKHIKKREILGLGIGLPGLVDFKKGLVFCLTNVPGWTNVPLKKILERNIGMPVFIDNDVKVMAIGELRFGAGRGYKNAICMTLGTGVGGAVIINGNLYRGASLVAGEIGHIPVNEDGPACNCGSSGCLEAYVGREYFLNDARKRIGRTPHPMLKHGALRGAGFTPERLSEAALKGNRAAADAWRKMGEHIGNALVGVVNLLNPQIIIIGGGMAGAGEILFGSIRKTVSKKSLRIPGRAVKIVRAKLGNDAGVIGAGELVKDNIGVRP
ncbi:MAG: ROK family protein [Candidatus Omnitrophota bacterium]|nr:ROK family protein [Candidatus Omnitrophota bacterium]